MLLTSSLESIISRCPFTEKWAPASGAVLPRARCMGDPANEFHLHCISLLTIFQNSSRAFVRWTFSMQNLHL